jgi:hypothetical protein
VCMNYSFIELRKGQSEGPKWKIVPPRGSSHDPGMNITEYLQAREKASLLTYIPKEP